MCIRDSCTMIDKVVKGDIQPLDAYWGLTPAGYETEPGGPARLLSCRPAGGEPCNRSGPGLPTGAHSILGGAEGDRRVELPDAELLFDLGPIPSRGGQPGRQPVGPQTHLFRFGQPLLGQPPPVALLKRFRQPTDVSEGEGRDVDADSEPGRPVRARCPRPHPSPPPQ